MCPLNPFWEHQKYLDSSTFRFGWLAKNSQWKSYLTTYNIETFQPTTKQVGGTSNFGCNYFATHWYCCTQVWIDLHSHLLWAPTHKIIWGDNWKIPMLGNSHFFMRIGQFRFLHDVMKTWLIFFVFYAGEN